MQDTSGQSIRHRQPTSGLSFARRATWLGCLLAAGFSYPAQAQFFWSPDPTDTITENDPPAVEPRRPRLVRHQRPRLPDAPKDTAKPVGSVVIAISIEKQQLKLYDSNGLFAETPVSTGMRGHSTPMGVFSVIQKNKWHRSNIYSGAPMPYMQRITWSGIALHAGVVPGYPASHGCIRLPTNFAMRLWGWTRLGARVVITPGEVAPTEFSHPRLIAHRPDAKMADVPEDTPHLRLTTLIDKPIQTADASGTALRMTDAPTSDPTDKSAAPEPGASPEQSQAQPSAAPEQTGALGDKDSHASDAGTASAPLPSVLPVEGEATFIGPVKPHTGHLAIYISGKTGKLYARQNFEPWFEMPVTIAPADHPLGTHIFTAQADKANADLFHWSVISLPAPSRSSSLKDEPIHKKHLAAVHMSAASVAPSPTEALDRVTIPENTLKQIASSLGPGSSIVISDQGLGDETGSGTDFIVPLR